MTTLKVMTVFGTRPEAIKMAMLVRALEQATDFEAVTVVTGQHREMLDQVLELFAITPHHDLDLMAPRQTLTQITTRSLDRLTPIIESVSPDVIVVQGDTTTTFMGALAAFYHQIPVVHLEAGLRTGDPRSPFPEEINRRLTSQLTQLHLPPTSESRQHLLDEGVDEARIVVTGNTVIDALHHVVSTVQAPDLPVVEAIGDDPVLLITAHRRESWGEPMAQMGRAMRRVAVDNPDLQLVFPMHLNPVVRETIRPLIEDLPNVHLMDPLSYGPFAWMMNRAHLILTDSGGVQEEGPSLGKPVLVMRDNTERPEAISAGTARLVGTDEDRIVDEVTRLLEDAAHYDAMANAVNPYGDGQAVRRSLEAMRYAFASGDKPADFDPSALA